VTRYILRTKLYPNNSLPDMLCFYPYSYLFYTQPCVVSCYKGTSCSQIHYDFRHHSYLPLSIFYTANFSSSLQLLRSCLYFAPGVSKREHCLCLHFHFLCLVFCLSRLCELVFLVLRVSSLMNFLHHILVIIIFKAKDVPLPRLNHHTVHRI